MNLGNSTIKVGDKYYSVHVNGTRKALKPILPKLPDYVKPKRNYDLQPKETFHGYGICYVCDASFYQGIRLWGSQSPSAGLATKIGQLLGDNFAVVVNADDVLCQKCYSLLIHIDQLEDELVQVRQMLRCHLLTKYNIKEMSADHDGQETPNDPPVVEKKRSIILEGKKAKPKDVQKCNMCEMEFDSLRALRKHNIKDHLANWKCHFCNEIFKDEKLFMDHTKSHLTDNSLQMAVGLQQTIANANLAHANLSAGLVEQLEKSICKNESTVLMCNLCGADFHHEDAYNEHIHTHQVLLDFESLDKPEALSLDGFGANAEAVDLMDMNIFDNSDSVEQTVKRLVCSDCGSEYETQEEMIVHMQTIHHLDPCYLCSEFFGSKEDIAVHIAETHAVSTTWLVQTDNERQSVSCGFCDALFDGDDELEKHAKECQLKAIETQTCTEELNSAEALAIHEDLCKDAMSGNEEPAEQKPKKTKKTRNATCVFCGELFPNKQSLLQHETDNPSHLTMQCPDCDTSFARDKDLNDHREVIHSTIHCRWCPKTFTNVKQIKAHEQRHVRSLFTVYDCEVCHRIFQTPTGLRHHMLSHTGNYKFICEYCGKGFASKARQEEHRACHTKEKRYTCEICGIKFSVQATYWIHRKWHDNPKPYQCQECGMFFKHSSLLSVHRRKHTGERPYACSHCDQTFSVSNSLKRHMALHTGTYAYSCETCNIGFPAKHKYAQHMSKVHDDHRLLLEQMSNKTRGLRMALKDPEKDETKAAAEEEEEEEGTWVLTEGLSETDHYLTLETEGGEKILLTGGVIKDDGGNQMVEIVLQDDQIMEDDNILGECEAEQD